MKLTLTRIVSNLWASGRPCIARDRSAAIPKIVKLGLKAGMTDQQALALGRIAFDSLRGYHWNLDASARNLRAATLEAKAAESPENLLSYVGHKLGSLRYVTEEQITDIHRNDFAGWSAWAAERRAIRDDFNAMSNSLGTLVLS